MKSVLIIWQWLCISTIFLSPILAIALIVYLRKKPWRALIASFPVIVFYLVVMPSFKYLCGATDVIEKQLCREGGWLYVIVPPYLFAYCVMAAIYIWLSKKTVPQIASSTELSYSARNISENQEATSSPRIRIKHPIMFVLMSVCSIFMAYINWLAATKVMESSEYSILNLSVPVFLMLVCIRYVIRSIK